MTATWYPFVKAPSSSSLKKTTGSEKETSFMGFFVNLAADETMEIETRVCDVMEVDERTITTLFYDRFVPFFCCLVFFLVVDFQYRLMQSTTDILSYDKALSNRVAALNCWI